MRITDEMVLAACNAYEPRAAAPSLDYWGEEHAADMRRAIEAALSRAAAPESSPERHYGRSWKGTRLEDECPCKKQPCGLVTFSDAERVDCDQHAAAYARTMRQSHLASACPGKPHTEHVRVTECWHMDCIEGDCDHRDEFGEPEDLSACPPAPTEVCVGCMVDRGVGADPNRWDDAPLSPWPCEKTGPLPEGASGAFAVVLAEGGERGATHDEPLHTGSDDRGGEPDGQVGHDRVEHDGQSTDRDETDGE